MLPVVAIVGRTNVGKSTLFNRLIGKREAITADWSGTTRDRLYGECSWGGKSFLLVDTAGLETSHKQEFDINIQEQINIAIDEADLLIFVVDTKTGITDKDLSAQKKLLSSKKPFIITCNKCDNAKDLVLVNDFYRFGCDEIFPVSALSGRGTGDLLDSIVKNIPNTKKGKTPKEESENIVIAIAGRPNVGKSSLLNSLVGNSRAIVSEKAGTTRDTASFHVLEQNKKLTFLDTAGIRRKGKVGKSLEGRKPGQIEKYSVLRSLQAIDKSSVVLALIDASEGITAQDTHIIGYAAENGKSVILVINKWDLVPDRNIQDYTEYLRKKISFLPYAPAIFVSAKDGKNVKKITTLILETQKMRLIRINTSELNARLHDDLIKRTPPKQKNILPTIKYVTQVSTNPPSFVFFTNHPELIHFSYRRYLENRLRGHWQFQATPINISFRKKGR